MISDLIQKGGVYYNIQGNDPQKILRAAAHQLELPQYVSEESLVTALIEREEMTSTAIGYGIAIPHPRSPLMKSQDEQVCVCFLDHPIDFEAIDGNDVFVLFIVLSSSAKSHLQILSECNYLFQREQFRQILQEKPDRTELIDLINRIS